MSTSKGPPRIAMLRVDLWRANQTLGRMRSKQTQMKHRIAELERENRDLTREVERLRTDADAANRSAREITALWRAELNDARAREYWAGPIPDPETGEMISSAEEYAKRLTKRGLLILPKFAH